VASRDIGHQERYPALAVFAKGAAMAATMNISLTEPLKRFVDEQVREGGFSSTSDYVRELIRERQRRAAETMLRSLIAEGLASGPAESVTTAFFAAQRKRLRK
jgi:antitoxin ParD1/3/4